MSIIIDEYLPVMGYVISVVEELVNNGNVNIETSLSDNDPYQKKLTGLALDVINVLLHFNPCLEINTEIKNYGQESFSIGENDEYKINLVLDGSLNFPVKEEKGFEGNYFLKHYNIHRDHTEQIKIYAYDVVKVIKSKIIDKISEIIPKCLPDDTQKIRLLFNDYKLSPFPITTFYQDFEPLSSFERPNIPETYYQYPVIGKNNKFKNLNKKNWRFFKGMLYWHAWSQYASYFLDVIYEKSTMEDLSKKHRKDHDFVMKNLMRTREFCMELIEVLICKDLTEKISEICKEFDIQKQYRRKAIEKPFKNLLHMVRPDTFGYMGVEKLINYYNIHHGSKINKQVTMAEICLRGKIDLKFLDEL